jgi:heme/copper-type cytochrome/quinol oxidase subunit 1
MSGRSRPAALIAVQFLTLFCGPILLAAPGILIGFGSSDSVLVFGVIGSLVTALGVLLVLASVFGGAGVPAPADPYGGLTLEWAAPAPLPRHNFHELPEIRSPWPLHDLREVKDKEDGTA